MSIPSYDSSWTEFTRRVYISTSPQMVYQSWAIQGELEQWFLKHSQFYNSEGEPRKVGELIRATDTYNFEWYNWPELSRSGKVISAIEDEELSFDFGDFGKVVIKFEEVEEFKTQIKLTHYDIPEDDYSKMNIYYGLSLRWSFWLINLKAFLEHGVLLNEKSISVEDGDRVEFVNH